MTASLLTVHAAAKRFANGFVPMITIRADKGRMVGCRCPEGAYREFRTFATQEAAKAEAHAIAHRMASRFPNVLRASA